MHVKELIYCRKTVNSLQFSFIIGLMFLRFNDASSEQSPKHPQGRQLLDIVLESSNYDLDKWPTFPTDDSLNVTLIPTKSDVWVDIMFISSINIEAMDITVDMYLNQKWNDKRLQFPETLSKRRLHLKTIEQFRRIWSPDTYIVNAKQANFHHITTENRVVYISGNGDVFYSARITAKVACEMKFQSFPMDTQDCILHLASYAYTTEILQMFWLKEGAVSYKKDMDLNQFHLTNVTTRECVDQYPDGGYPCLKIYFRFERRVAHHLIQTFLPTVLIVTISWVSFYIQAEAVPARIALGITTLLTMITLNSGTKQGLPPVSYIKAIDVWMGVCTFFVFSAIWEYVAVVMLARRPIKCPHKTTNAHNPDSSMVIANSYADPLSARDSLRITSPEFGWTVPLSTQTPTTELRNMKSSSTGQESPSPRSSAGGATDVVKVVWEPRYSRTSTSVTGIYPTDLARNHSMPGDPVTPRRKKRPKVNCNCVRMNARSAQEKSKRVDILARFLYPLMFLLFNLIYWPYYLFVEPKSNYDMETP